MRPYLLLTVSAAALTLGAGLVARWRGRKAAEAGKLSSPGEGFEPRARDITRQALKWFVVPVWTGAGVADWLCHRASGITETTGLKESIIHILMMLEAGGPILAALLLEIDPMILSAIIACFFLHEATAMWDVSYAASARDVSPIEQHVHSFLEIVPLLAGTLISLLHWPQLQALAGLRVEAPRPIEMKREPVGGGYVLGALGAFLALEIAPYVEEAVRDWRAHPRRLQPPAARLRPHGRRAGPKKPLWAPHAA